MNSKAQEASLLNGANVTSSSKTQSNVCLPIQVCKGFANASEAVFEEHCRVKRWRPPRRPR